MFSSRTWSRRDWSDFHRACEPNHPLHSVEHLSSLLEKDPEAASRANGNGDYPILAAIYPRCASAEVIELLLEACPSAPFSKSPEGYTAWEHFQVRYCNRQYKMWDICRLFLKAHHRLYTTNSVFRPLHTAVSCKSHFGKRWFLKMVLDLDKENVLERNELGQCPLHVMLSNPYEDHTNENVKMVLHACQEAAAVPDNNGRFPLSLAIKAGYEWEVIQLLLDAAPQAVSCDVESSFWIAAFGNCKEIDTLYSLLHHDPTQVSLVTHKMNSGDENVGQAAKNEKAKAGFWEEAMQRLFGKLLGNQSYPVG